MLRRDFLQLRLGVSVSGWLGRLAAAAADEPRSASGRASSCG